MPNYRLVSELRRDGQWIDVPDDAVDLKVEPLPRAGVARVTYLRPIWEVEIDQTEPDRTYVH